MRSTPETCQQQDQRAAGALPRLTMILMLHAESGMQGCYLGRSDPPLSDRGRVQAANVAQRLVGQPLVALYSSPLRRALHAAQAIAAPHGLELNLIADLAELDFGAWDGLSYAEIERREPETLGRSLADPVVICPPGGETLARVGQRVVTAARAITTHHSQGTVAVVSHAGPIRALICHAVGLTWDFYWRIGKDLAALTCLDWYDDDVILTLLNGTCHLRALGQ